MKFPKKVFNVIYFFQSFKIKNVFNLEMIVCF